MKPILKQIQNQSRMHQGIFQINCLEYMQCLLFVVFVVVGMLVRRVEIVQVLFFVISYLTFFVIESLRHAPS